MNYAEIGEWVTILGWLAISIYAAVDSYLEWRVARRRYRLVATLGNGRVIVAISRRRIASWFLAGFTSSLFTGFLAFANQFSPYDLRWFLRALLIFMIFSFWRAKKNNRKMRQQFESRGDAAAVLKVAADHLQTTADDTNVRVREMQTRGQTDQPLEATDRDEGHEHRVGVEDALEADTEKRAQERQDDREERSQERQDDREERSQERQDDREEGREHRGGQ